MKLRLEQTDAGFNVYHMYVGEVPGRERMAVAELVDRCTAIGWVLEGKLSENLDRFFTEEQVTWIKSEFPKRLTMINVTHRLTR